MIALENWINRTVNKKVYYTEKLLNRFFLFGTTFIRGHMGTFPVTSCLAQNSNALLVRGKVPLVHNLPKKERNENNASLSDKETLAKSRSTFGPNGACSTNKLPNNTWWASFLLTRIFDLWGQGRWSRSYICFCSKWSFFWVKLAEKTIYAKNYYCPSSRFWPT